MVKALSLDLRVRVLKAVSEGASHRTVAERFGVSAASVSRWRALARKQGEPRPIPLDGDRRSGRIEAQGGPIRDLLAATPDITTEELRAALAECGHAFGYGRLQRFFRRHGLTRKKKTGHATEQDRPDILKRRQEWFDGQIDLDPERLVFIDKTWAKTNMARTHGRCPKGERLRMGFPHGHWKTTTFVGALTMRGMIAPFVLSGAINRDAFETYVEKVLAPELRPGDIVVMDNLSSHKGSRTRALIEAAGASRSRPSMRWRIRVYARNWLTIIPACGGDLHGYWLPHEGTNDVALAMISFPSLADYEAYRARLKTDAAGAANFRIAQELRFILSEERTFLEHVTREGATG